MRSLAVTVFSLSLTAAVIGNAYYQKKQFYPSVVYITKSNTSMAVIYIQALIMVILMGKLMRKVFFGQLRAAEFEHLVERSWYALTETCLAFTVFRDDFNPKFVAFFTILLFFKSFHWLAEDRVDYMERSPVIGVLFHVRVLSLLIMLALHDLFFIEYAYESTVTKGVSVQLVFGFEYSILIIMIVNIAIKYLLHAIDSYWETPWENKAVVLLYTELVVGFLKVLLYVSFVAIMVRKYTLPLFAFRPMYYTIRNFKKAFNDVVLSRRAIRNMNTLYPDATPAELAAVDNVCIICREEMNSGAKKLPCNHIFHASCLRSWFQRQQTCPTCRLNILRSATASPNVAAAAPAPQANPAPVPPPPPSQTQPATGAAPPNLGNIPNFTPMISFPWPPPPMPPNLATLTPAELARMEGRERQNVEARIQCLRNIQLMLDASVMMMQQYSAVATRFNPADPRDAATQTCEAAAPVPPPSAVPQTSPPSPASPQPDTPTPGTSTSSTSNPIPSTSSSAAPTIAPAVVEASTSQAGNETKVKKEPAMVPSETLGLLNEDDEGSQRSLQENVEEFLNAESNASGDVVQNEDKAADELRRRRLQKFNQEQH